MKIDIFKHQIEKAKDNEKIILLTQKQIVKDFMLHGVSIQINEKEENLSYEYLFNAILIEARYLMQNNYMKFISILYQIDISPKDISDFSLKEKELPEEEKISHLIIARAMKKVILRMEYS